MKLRLDEYYYILNIDSVFFYGIEEYMSKDIANKYIEFSKSHYDEEIDEYLHNLYSHIDVINIYYDTKNINLDIPYIKYTAIIKIKDKYYSFDWYYTLYWDLEKQVNADLDLVEVFPKEATITVYEPK